MEGFCLSLPALNQNVRTCPRDEGTDPLGEAGNYETEGHRFESCRAR